MTAQECLSKWTKRPAIHIDTTVLINDTFQIPNDSNKTMDFTCLFNGCSNPALPTGKCEAHKHRAKCAIEDCYNQTYARNMCVKHGGRQKCQFDGCSSKVRSQGFCCKHGPSGNNKNLCHFEGCMRAAHARHRCVRHGGGQKCKMEDCTKFARSGGLCYRHSGVVRQSSITNDVAGQDEDLLSSIMGDASLMHFSSVDDLLADACNCDIDFTTEEQEMLDYFIAA
ncbi:hypothetical protein AeMF1_014568 [Aphanomyces euteiches]|nr:hypothetical protein AeMF1_014568 [Aphanomyces euteiches]KAH9187989.1 hypothetical protein AeNC1_010035 [Aphanomyces euteiches]